MRYDMRYETDFDDESPRQRLVNWLKCIGVVIAIALIAGGLIGFIAAII